MDLLLEILRSHCGLLSKGGSGGRRETGAGSPGRKLGCWIGGVRGSSRPKSGRLHPAGASAAPL